MHACVHACMHVYVLRIVSMDKILHFISTLIIIITLCFFGKDMCVSRHRCVG